MTNVSITLEGSAFTLEPTALAAEHISRHFDGFRLAHEALAEFKPAAFCAIVYHAVPAAHGIIDRLSEEQWAKLMPDLLEPLYRYVSLLMNGGRDEDQAEAPTPWWAVKEPEEVEIIDQDEDDDLDYFED